MTTTNTPRVYVGTYAKYNNGSIEGEWLDLTDFKDSDEFYEKCKEIHSDENDPEFMFQDFENGMGMISEMGIDDKLWEIIEAELSDEEFEALTDYLENDKSRSIDDFRDDWNGYYKSELDFTYQIIDECYDLEKMGDLQRYFDYEAFTRDLFMTDYWYSANGHVFRNS